MIVQVLEEAGVEYVFGIPGGGTMAIFDALYQKQDTIKTILVRHEQTAAIMADACGRATGKPAVIMGQGVFMGSNASFGVMEAFLSSSPMVVITDTSDGNMPQHPVNQSGSGEYGSIDLQSIFRAMTKFTTLATDPKQSVIGTQLAIKHATSGRPGPTCVLMRSAAIVGEVDVESPPFIHPTGGYLNMSKAQAAPTDMARAVELLAGARNPAIVAGNGVHLSHAHEQLRELAEQWGMPVATTYKGKSAVAETHPLSVGMLGVFGQKIGNAAIGDADVILVVGAKMTPQDTVRERPHIIDPNRQRIIQIDIDERNAGWTFPVELGLIGDARVILDQLVEASRPAVEGRAKTNEVRLRALQQQKKAKAFFTDAALEQDSAPALPQRVVRLIQETVDPSTLITLDAGNNRVWMCHYYQTQEPNTVFAPGGTAGMGWALPAALGLKLVRPERPVVAVTGDGGFVMTAHALSTAVQYNIPVVCIIMNDSALGMVRHHQHERQIASQFESTDHVMLAKGFGALGLQVTDSRELPDAIREAQASGRPAVIDVLIDHGPNPDDIRASERGSTET
jgi:acetolactate synthase-1/2/3 large subunit